MTLCKKAGHDLDAPFGRHADGNCAECSRLRAREGMRRYRERDWKRNAAVQMRYNARKRVEATAKRRQELAAAEEWLSA